jgi:hypothetical protein
MRLYVQIQDDNGEILAEHEADACQPSVWNAPSGKSLVGKMPQNSDNKNTGTYELFRIIFQPTVRVSRPNGYEEPSRPLTGQGLPANFPQIKSWSKSAPTAPNTLGLRG